MTLADLLGANITSGLCAKSYENRLSVAEDIETLISKSFNSSSEKSVAWADDCLDCINDELTKSIYADHRKGGLVAFASVILGARGRLSQRSVEITIARSTELIADEDAKVRAAACEALYNIIKACRGRCMGQFSSMLKALCKLYGDSELDNRQMAPLLDRALKEVVAEFLESNPDEGIFDAILSTFSLPNLMAKQVCLGWISLIKSLPNSSLYEKLSLLIPNILSLICSDASMVAGWRDVAVSADHLLTHLLLDLESRKSNILSEQSVEACLKLLIKYARFQDSLTSDRSRVLLFEWIGYLAPLCRSESLLADVVVVIVKSLSSETSESVIVTLEKTNKALMKKEEFTENFSAQSVLHELQQLLPTVRSSHIAIDWIAIAATRYPLEDIDLLLSVKMEARVVDSIVSNFSVELVACKFMEYARDDIEKSILSSKLIVEHFQEDEKMADFLFQVSALAQAADRIMIFELLRTVVLSGKFTALFTNDLLVDSLLGPSVFESNKSAGLLVAVMGKRWASFLSLAESLSPESDTEYIEKLVLVLESNFFATLRKSLFSERAFAQGLAIIAMLLSQTSPAFQPLSNRLQLVSIFKSV